MQGKAPLVERAADGRDSLVTYLWRGNASTRNVGMLGGVPTSERRKWDWHRVRGSDVWFNSQRTPDTARFGYALRENDGSYQTDPLNPRTCAGRSIVELAGAPPERAAPTSPAASIEPRSIRSAILGEERAFALLAGPEEGPLANGS